jgi:hypothetical protein
MVKLVKILAISMLLFSTSYFSNTPVYIFSPAQAADCIASNNLSSTAEAYISRCRKGSIRSVFPSQFLSATLATIRAGKTAAHKTAWKLLNDGRFAK